MQEVFDAIVIRSITYSDSSMILKCYTKQKGIVSFIARGVKKRKKNHVMALLQPLSIVEITSYSKRETNKLKTLKDIKSSFFYKTLHSDPLKTSLSFFFSEILSSTLHEEESNIMLFNFIASSLQYLDGINTFSNFHIAFLLELSKYLGFYPNIENINGDYFNLEQGIFCIHPEKAPFIYSGDVIVNLKKILKNEFTDSSSISLSRSQRSSLLNLIVHYYSLHISGFKEPKSLYILQSLY